MATYSKPAKIPRWADTSANILEPSEGKKDAGWLFQEIPPSNFENWRTNLAGEWLKWIDERWDDGATADVLESQMPLGIDGSTNFILEDAAGDPRMNFRGLGGDSYMLFDESAAQWELWVAGAKQIHANASGVFINGDLDLGDDLVLPGGLVVGFSGSAEDDRIKLGDDSFYLDWTATVTTLRFDTSGGNSGLQYNRTNDQLLFQNLGATEALLGADGLRILKGLYVGETNVSPTDNKIYAQGVIEAGGALIAGSTIDATGDATFGTITMPGFTVDDDGDVVGKTVRALNGPQLTSSGISQAEAITGATSITGSGALAMGTIAMTGFTVDADGDVVGKTVRALNGPQLTSSGISQAEVISGATTIDASGDLTVGSITMTGNIHTTGDIGRDSTDYLDFTNNLSMRIVLNGAEKYTFSATAGLDLHGLAIVAAGNIAGTGLALGTGTIGAGGITCLGLNAGAGAIQTTGGGTFGQLNASSGGILNAGAISGATSVNASGIGIFGSLNATGLENNSGGITNAGAISAAAITCSSLSAGSGAIDCGSLDVSSGGITNAGAISGAAAVTCTSLDTLAGTISAGAITCTSLSTGAGALDCGSLDVSAGGITNAGAISGASTIDASGDLSVGSITMTGDIYTSGKIGLDSTDYILFANNTQMDVYVGAANKARFQATGLNVNNGIHAGDLTTAPSNDAVTAVGFVQAPRLIASNVTSFPSSIQGSYQTKRGVPYHNYLNNLEAALSNTRFVQTSNTAGQPSANNSVYLELGTVSAGTFDVGSVFHFVASGTYDNDPNSLFAGLSVSFSDNGGSTKQDMYGMLFSASEAFGVWFIDCYVTVRTTSTAQYAGVVWKDDSEFPASGGSLICNRDTGDKKFYIKIQAGSGNGVYGLVKHAHLQVF